jgi:hypothetical protein
MSCSNSHVRFLFDPESVNCVGDHPMFEHFFSFLLNGLIISEKQTVHTIFLLGPMLNIVLPW